MLTARLIGGYLLHSVVHRNVDIIDMEPKEEVKEEPKEEVKEEVKEEPKEEVKEEVKEEPKEEVKEEPKEEVKQEPKEEVKEEVKVKVNTSKKSKKSFNDDKIGMQNRKVCPVKIPIKKKSTNNNIENNKEEEHRLYHFVEHLRSMNINFNPPKRMPTGLYELDLYQINKGVYVKLSFDIDGLLYSDDIKFFIGHVNPGEEYVKPAIIMTKKSLEAVINNNPIPAKYYVNETLFNLNKVLDMQSLKEKDPEKRSKVFEIVGKAISDPDIYNGILKASNGEAFRFAFCRYVSTDEFSIVSSKRNLSSNLSNDRLRVSKEIWINIKDKNVELITKKNKS